MSLRATLLAACLAAVAMPAHAKPSPAGCAKCHSSWDKLPPGHPPVQGATLSACISCHAPSTDARPNKFFSALHRAHRPPAVDCVVCHVQGKGGSYGLTSTKVVLGKVPEGDARLRAAVASWTGSPFLDARHAKGSIGCAGCHAGDLPEVGADVSRARCLACHGPEDKLVERSAPPVHKDRNPHRSHLGEIECTVCHHAHVASENYCLGCHPKFEMKLPEATAAR